MGKTVKIVVQKDTFTGFYIARRVNWLGRPKVGVSGLGTSPENAKDELVKKLTKQYFVEYIP
jgi:hypothetical protein